MNDDFLDDEMVLPDFDAIDELQLFDAGYSVDIPFQNLDDMSVSFK